MAAACEGLYVRGLLGNLFCTFCFLFLGTGVSFVGYALLYMDLPYAAFSIRGEMLLGCCLGTVVEWFWTFCLGRLCWLSGIGLCLCVDFFFVPIV